MPTTVKKTLQLNQINPAKTQPRSKSSSVQRKIYTWRAGDFTRTLGIKTQIMGILNLTPDSFSDDGLLSSKQYVAKALDHAEEMVAAGADLLDIGGESSRPGAKEISVQEEKDRVLPVMEALGKRFDIPLSVDTYKPEVAKAAIGAGASIINTIKGTQLTSSFIEVLAQSQVGIILMHMYGDPSMMQNRYSYTDCVQEIKTALRGSVEKCLKSGIHRERIMIDPGIGFGKSVEHNLQMINQIPLFNVLNQPILLGTSRKSFIGHILEKDVDKRLHGSLGAVCASILRGCHMVRVHDVAQTREAVDVVDAILNEGLT